MDYFGTIITMIGLLFLSIIGVYVWTFKVYKNTQESLGKIYTIMNTHLQNAQIHGDVDKYVPRKEYEVVCEALKEDVGEIKIDIKCILSKI